ncbi:MAG: FlgD immunoglobulin-like domain containing protein, partial [Calditrichia bacterium]
DMIMLDVASLPGGATMNPALPFSGPNTGISSTFDWTPSAGQAGNYTVSYSVTDTSGATSSCSVDITVNAPGGDQDAPTCDLDAVNPGPPVSIDIRVQDMQSGIASIIVLKAKNATVNIPSFTVGDTGPIMVTATKIDNSKGASVALETMDVAGNSSRCDPVYTKLSSAIPESFDLAQNYPNPFNPSTTIHFNVPALENNATAVQLVVYDLTGREVATLVNDVLNAGEYSVQWDGTSSNGKQVAGGVYIYRMVAGDFVQTRKMVLMK